MHDSIFTKIIKGEIPCHKVYEDNRTLAFLDIHPKQPGQIVVVPKKQVNFVWDLDDDDYTALMSTVQKIGQKLREVYPDKKRVGVTIEGFDVEDHAHVVVLPFDTVAQFHGVGEIPTEPDDDALKQIAEKLKIQ